MFGIFNGAPLQKKVSQSRFNAKEFLKKSVGNIIIDGFGAGELDYVVLV
jgi:hypothetical protein